MVSIAIIILIGIQTYWIKNAVELREANFQRSVSEAVNDLMSKIEKEEINRQIRKNREYNSLLRSIDSLDYLIYLETGNYDHISSGGSFSYQRHQEWDQVPDGNGVKLVKKSDTVAINYPGQENQASDETTVQDSDIPQNSDIPKSSDNSRDENEIINIDTSKKSAATQSGSSLSETAVQLNRKKAFLLNQVFDEMFNNPFTPFIENWLTKGKLDTLLMTSLENKGIDAKYEFGVFSKSRNLMVIEKDPELRQDLLQEGTYYRLFPANTYAPPDFLVLYFPNQTRYLLLQMGGMLTISGLLMLFIIFAFMTVIMAIFRQKKLSEMKNDFINNMTHEFKTPISTVSLACEVLNDESVPKSEEFVRSYIDIISEENKRLGLMAEKILQTAILEKGQLKLRKEKINLHNIIEDVVHKIAIQVQIRDGSILTELNAAEPEILADKVHVTNVINNLLDNANKYSPRKPMITIMTKNLDNGVQISITDNGIGIHKANLKKIFEKLYRVPTGDVHNVKGFGLGLSYVQFIVEKHEGRVNVESEQGKGSTFRIWLPHSA